MQIYVTLFFVDISLSGGSLGNVIFVGIFWIGIWELLGILGMLWELFVCGENKY